MTVLCTVAHPEVHAKFAMKVGGRATLDEFAATTWEEFGRQIGWGRPSCDAGRRPWRT